MNYKKQTAVDWLVEQIDNKDMGEIPMWIYDFIKQAKEKEKEQIMNAYEHNLNGLTVLEQEEMGARYAEQYYKETYEASH